MKSSNFHVRCMLACLLTAGCNKETDESNLTPTSEIIYGISSNVIVDTYTDLAAKSALLEASLVDLKNNTTEANLEASRQLWKETRQSWEQAEGFLFGPVSTEDIDPAIDTWPVNFLELDSLLTSSTPLTTDYLNSLTQDALRGFHPLEYLLWGKDGNKQPIDFTQREKEYSLALGTYIAQKTSFLSSRWNDNGNASYRYEFEKAGDGSGIYSSRKDALLEVVSSMQAICEEVADGKIGEPFLAQNKELEESPFSGNSISDFTNNMRSVQNIYTGSYLSDGKGIQDLVRNYNLSLDAEINQKITTAISALQTITLPFGEAIFSQPQQVANAQSAIHDLKLSLDKLPPFIQQKVKD